MSIEPPHVPDAGTHPARAGSLPQELTSFVGRRRQLGEVKRLLAASRLVTLTGLGGVGKTRLARRAAARLRPHLPDGVRFVDLAAVRDPELLAQQLEDTELLANLVASALGLREHWVRSPLQLLTGYLARRQLLLLLDNCEHVLPACASLTEALLRACPRLRILTTSREPLRASGEAVFVVAPLSIPDSSRPRQVDRRCESVALFVARAREVVPGFRLAKNNERAVAALCHRLEGLPLAVELAAARVRTLEPQQLLERLGDRFAVLDPNGHEGPDRRHTLRACIDWSFELCAKPERILWARLSVFAGGFELDGVEGVCADDELPEADILDLVGALLDKSILVGDGHGPVVRYRMLETIRDYGHARLVEAGEETTLRRRHRDWHHWLVAQAHTEWVSERQGYWLDRLGREHPNLRAAVEYCLTQPGQAEAALRIVVSIPGFYWWTRGLFSEGRRWLDRALAQNTELTTLRARALLTDSYLALAQGDADAGLRLLDEGQTLARRLNAAAEITHGGFIQGLGALYRGDLPVALETLQQAVATLSTAPEQDLDLQLHLLLAVGTAAGLAGDHDRASACLEEILAITELRGESFHRSVAMWTRGLLTWLQGDGRQAADEVTQSLRLKLAWGPDDQFGVAFCLELLAWIMASRQRHRRAAVLLGAAETIWADLGSPLTSYQHLIGYHDACERQARESLGAAAFAEAVRQGRALRFQDTLAYALDERPGGAGRSHLSRRRSTRPAMPPGSVP